MTKGKARTFRECGKAIRDFHGKGSCTDEQLQSIRKGIKLLDEYLRGLAKDLDIQQFPRLKRALQEAYRDPSSKELKDYCIYMMIRDTADICRTMQRLIEGKERTQSEKTTIAYHLCVSLDEFLLHGLPASG